MIDTVFPARAAALGAAALAFVGMPVAPLHAQDPGRWTTLAPESGPGLSAYVCPDLEPDGPKICLAFGCPHGPGQAGFMLYKEGFDAPPQIMAVLRTDNGEAALARFQVSRIGANTYFAPYLPAAEAAFLRAMGDGAQQVTVEFVTPSGKRSFALPLTGAGPALAQAEEACFVSPGAPPASQPPTGEAAPEAGGTSGN